MKGDFWSEETKEMSSSSIVVKGLERKDREKAAEFVKRMMSWSMKTHLKGGYSKKSLEHDVSVAVHALDSAINDPSYYCTLAIKDGKVVGVAIGQLVRRLAWPARRLPQVVHPSLFPGLRTREAPRSGPRRLRGSLSYL